MRYASRAPTCGDRRQFTLHTIQGIACVAHPYDSGHPSMCSWVAAAWPTFPLHPLSPPSAHLAPDSAVDPEVAKHCVGRGHAAVTANRLRHTHPACMGGHTWGGHAWGGGACTGEAMHGVPMQGGGGSRERDSEQATQLRWSIILGWKWPLWPSHLTRARLGSVVGISSATRPMASSGRGPDIGHRNTWGREAM